MNPLSIDATLQAAKWSKMAYSDPPQTARQTAEHTWQWADFLSGNFLTLVNMLPERDVQCLIVKEAKRMTFACRGTNDMRGWLVDASIAFCAYSRLRPETKFHSGFYADVDAILPLLRPFAQQAYRENIPMFGTGHSKGGGEILPLAYRLARESGIVLKGVTTFGGPRVFNRAGSRDYETLLIPTWRVLDEDDIVCRIPWRLGLYRHVGQSVFFNGWGNMAENEPWYAHIPSDIYVLIHEALRKENAPVYDHSIDRYIARIEAYKTSIGI